MVISNEFPLVEALKRLIAKATQADTDVYLFPNIPAGKQTNAREAHKLKADDPVYFLNDHTSWGSAKKSMVITDKGVSEISNASDSPSFRVMWEEIYSVDVIDNKIYLFYEKNRNGHYVAFNAISSYAGFHRFLKCADVRVFLIEACSFYRSLYSYYEQKEYDDFLIVTEAFLQANPQQDSVSWRYLRADVYFRHKQEPEKAWQECEYAFSFLKRVKDHFRQFDLNCLAAEILTARGEIYTSMECYVNAIKCAPGLPEKTNCRKEFEKLYDRYIQSFSGLRYDEKRLVMVTDIIQDMKSRTFVVLEKKKLPRLTFPIGHPVANILYVSHPYVSDKYIEIQNYGFELFQDKVNEFCYFLQCLGATELEISSREGSVDETGKISASQQQVSASVGVGGDVGTNEANAVTQQNLVWNNILRHQMFTPRSKPYLPDSLVWYPHEISWQRLYEQRMNGNLLEHREMISINKETNFLQCEMSQIRSEYDGLLIWIQGGKEKMKEEWNINQNHREFSVIVKFKPLDELV